MLENLGIDLSLGQTQIIHIISEKVAVGAKNIAARETQSYQNEAISEFGTNLTLLATEDKIDPVLGREQEIERVIQILGRRTKNNPMLIGEPGVGKTAIAEGLAQRIISQDVPELLRDKQVISLDLGQLVAGTRFRGEFKERLKQVMAEVRQAGNIILVIDEVHTLVGAGSAEGGKLQCIGATTLDEYREYIERDAALERRFQPVMVEEPSVEDTIEILRGVRSRYKDCLVTEGYDPSYGARPLRRAVSRLVEDNLAEAILSGQIQSGDTAVVDIDDDGQVQVQPKQLTALVGTT